MAAQEHDGGRSPSLNPTRVEHSLDDLARGLASGTLSRGKALRWMGGALVGAALASIPGVAWAAPCPTGQTRCNDGCFDLQTDERHCGSCRNRCSSNQTCCGGRCVNLQRNERHCGSCFNRCIGAGEEGDECVGGVCHDCLTVACEGGTVNPSTCQCVCPSPKTLQNGACVCPSGRIECGTQCCQTGETCVGGMCQSAG